MRILRRAAYPMLAAMFVVGGVDSVMHAEGKVKLAEKVTRPLTRQVRVLPNDTELLVKLNGAMQVIAGILLGIGKLPRLASLVLIGSIVPTTLAGHRFWEELDESKRAQQRVHLLKNLGLLGGLILVGASSR